MTKSPQGWNKLLDICLNITNKQELCNFLIAILTPEEYENIAKRMIVLEALMKKELSQRDIAEKYEISIAKITRGSNELKRMPSDLKAKLEQFLT